jgi:drug/metabolite transporter (DMT)-like permease
MSRRQTDKPAFAILIMVAAVAMLVAMNTLVKIIGPDYHAFQIAFLRNVVAAVVLIPFVLKSGGMAVLRTRRPGLQLIRSISGLTGVCCIFFAVQRLPVAEVMVISQAVPLFVTALAVPLLAEKVGWRRWSAAALGFVGVLLALGPVGEVSVAALIAVLGTALWSITILTVRKLGATDSPAATTFYYMVFGTLAAGLVQPWVWRAPPADLWLLFAGAGILGAIAQLLIAHALRIGEASVVSPFNYTAIVWGIAIDLAIWGAYPSVWTLAGAAVITAAGLYIFRREARTIASPHAAP